MATPSEIFSKIQATYDRASSRDKERLGFVMSLAQQTYDRFKSGELSAPIASRELSANLKDMRRRATMGSTESATLESALSRLRKQINEHPATVAFLESKAQGVPPSAATKPIYDNLEDIWEEAAAVPSSFSSGTIDFSEAKLRIQQAAEKVKAMKAPTKQPSRKTPSRTSTKAPSKRPSKRTSSKRPSSRPLAWPGMIENPKRKIVAISYDAEKAYPHSKELEGPFEILIGPMRGKPDVFENTMTTEPISAQVGEELAKRLKRLGIPFEVYDLTDRYDFWVTNAPEHYDGFGTTWIGTITGIGIRGSEDGRIVGVPKDQNWQQNRYKSGLYISEEWSPRTARKQPSRRPKAVSPKRRSPQRTTGPVSPWKGKRSETIEEFDNFYVLWRATTPGGSDAWWIITDHAGKIAEGTRGTTEKEEALAQWRKLTHQPSVKVPKKRSSRKVLSAEGPLQPGIAPRVGKIHLQSVGDHDAIPAAYLQPGDVTVWNFGMTSKVLEIEPVGNAFVRAQLLSDRAGVGERTTFRRLKASRLVAVTKSAANRVRGLSEVAAKRPSARKRQSKLADDVNRPLARHLIDQFNRALAPLFDGYFFRVYEDRGPGGVGVAVEAAQAPAGASKQQALKCPVIVGLYVTGYPEAGKQWIVGDPAPPEVQAYARSARTGAALPPLARLFGHHHGLPQQMAAKVINFFRRYADAIKSAPPEVQMGQKIEYMKGFRLREPSIQRCLGRREIQRMLDKHIDDENLVEHLVERLARLAHKNEDMPWAMFEEMAEESVRETGSNEDPDTVSYAFESELINRGAENTDIVRFRCSDVDPMPPTGGDLLENTEWALEASGADPNLAPSLIASLQSLQDSRKGNLLDDGILDDTLYDWQTVQGREHFAPDQDALKQKLFDALVLVEVPYFRGSMAPVGLFFPPARYARTPIGVLEFLADEWGAWETGAKAKTIFVGRPGREFLDLRSEVDREEYDSYLQDHKEALTNAGTLYEKKRLEEPWVQKKAPSKRPSAKRPSAKRPSAKRPSAKRPSAKRPSAKRPSAKRPSAKRPSAKRPSAKRPSAKRPSAKRPSAKRPSAKKPSAKRPSAKKPSAKKPSVRKLLITAPGAFEKLASIEGKVWERKQKAGGVKLDNSFALNLEAFKIIEQQGLAGLDIPLSDLDQAAGAIAGFAGTGYIVMPDGEIMLDGVSASDTKRRKAARIMQVID